MTTVHGIRVAVYSINSKILAFAVHLRRRPYNT